MKTVEQVSPAADHNPLPLGRLLERAVAEGVITPEQSSALADMDAGPPSRARFRSAVVVEVLGYLGAAIAVVSGLLIGAEMWAELASWARVGLLFVLTVVAAAAAIVLADRTGAIGRLASFLWAITVVGVSSTVGVAASEFLDLVSEESTLMALAVGTAVALGIYLRRRVGLQQVVLFVGVVGTSAMALTEIDTSLGESVGFLIWAIGVAWLLATWGHYLEPVAVGYALGSLGAVVGPFVAVSVDERLSLSLGLVTAVAVLVGGIRARRGAVIGIAVVATLAYLPRMFGAFFADMFGPMAVAFLVGVVLLGVAVALARLLPRDEDES